MNPQSVKITCPECREIDTVFPEVDKDGVALKCKHFKISLKQESENTVRLIITALQDFV